VIHRQQTKQYNVTHMCLVCMSGYIPYGLIRKREVAVKVMDCCWRTSNSWEIIALVISPRRQGGSLSWDSWYSLGSRRIEGRIFNCCGREHWKNHWLNLQKFSVFFVLMKYKKNVYFETVHPVIPLWLNIND